MGAIGSDRKYRASEIKPILENQISININAFNNDNLLVPGNSFTNFYIKCSQHLSEVFVEIEEDFLVLKYCYKHCSQKQQIFIEKSQQIMEGLALY